MVEIETRIASSAGETVAIRPHGKVTMRTTSGMTAVEAGLNDERQIQIALQAIVDHGGQANSSQLYAAIERYFPVDVALSLQGQDLLLSLMSGEALQKSYVKSCDGNRAVWHITEQGRNFLDEVKGSLGTESEELLPDEPIAPALADGPITEPFNTSAIKVDLKLMTVFQVMRKIAMREIDLCPDFQRNFVWNPTRQSRLIESVLLRIPLPAFYLDASNQGRWLVVDGLQRLTTLDRFYTNQLELANLEYLRDIEGSTFAQLPRSLQRQIEDETSLNLYVIQPETPPKVKFMIFSRVNTGGLVLTQQEIRHALFHGRSISYLAELATLPEFLSATDHSVSSLRMDDRECVLRFLAFHTTDYQEYRNQSFDGFLSEMMERLNKMPESDLDRLKQAFIEAMVKSQAVFGRDAFRKTYTQTPTRRRNQISKPLFEAWSVILLAHPLAKLALQREAIKQRFIHEMNTNVEFNRSISYGTGSRTAIAKRFSTIESLLEEVMQ